MTVRGSTQFSLRILVLVKCNCYYFYWAFSEEVFFRYWRWYSQELSVFEKFNILVGQYSLSTERRMLISVAHQTVRVPFTLQSFAAMMLKIKLLGSWHIIICYYRHKHYLCPLFTYNLSVKLWGFQYKICSFLCMRGVPHS